jgi:protein involved in polysaccharide export with SLBB domain
MLAFFLLPLSLYAQNSQSRASRNSNTSAEGEDTLPIEARPSAQLVLSTPDYRVTAGDIYTLSYAAGNQAVQYIIPVDSTYRIRVANMGIIDASGKTFPQLKTQVEQVVTNNYPLSGVQFVLTQPAVFRVYVKGEVKLATDVTTWGLMRLSSLSDPENITPYTSLRDVTVQTPGGQPRVYDLFKASRFGDLSQDPYLRPGDVITFNRVSRAVTVYGAVERPGAYQLLEGENLKELIGFYSSGLTPLADASRIELVRQVNSTVLGGEKLFLNEDDINNNTLLENYDVLLVPEITQLAPVMFIEGAIRSSDNPMVPGTEIDNASVSSRVRVNFNSGENYAPLVRRYVNQFTAESDTQNAYIVRNNEQIPVNLNIMLYDASFRSRYFVEENDVLVIPFRQYFVTVAGAVALPGRYPYIPDRNWDYYVALAGGFDPDQNSRQSVDIIDISGKKLAKTSVIGPETTITARANSFLYHFNQYAPAITTVLTIVTTFITVTMYMNSR